MKKVMSSVLAITLAVSNLAISPKKVEAATTFTVDGLKYSVMSASSLTVSINGATDKGITSLDIPETVTYEDVEYTVKYISSNAFNGYTSLTNVVIGDKVTTIDYNAFYACSELSSVEFSDAITSIGSKAFYNCSKLTNVKLPNKINKLSNGCFENCEAITEVTIPASLMYGGGAGSGAFKGCDNIKLSFEDGMDRIPEYMYSGCEWVTSIVIPDGIKTVGHGAFESCNELRNVEIPDSVTTISSYAFYKTGNLNSVVLGENVSKIQNNAFQWCVELTTINLPETLTTIETNAFSGCGKLTGIVLPSQLKTIGGTAFENCVSITEVTIPKTLTVGGSARSGAFKGCDNIKINFEEGIKTIPQYLFSGCNWLKSIVIPEDVKTIGHGAFESCLFLTDVTMPNSVKEISPYAFYKDEKLDNVVMSTAVEKILSNAFQYCSSLASIDLPESLELIGAYAFSDCTALTGVELPSKLIEINSGGFKNCPLITEVTIPATLEVGGSAANGAFVGCDNMTRVEFAEDTEVIAKYLFSGCKWLESIEIPNTVTHIYQGAFEQCSNLEEIILPNSVEELGQYVFYKNPGLKNVYVGEDIKKIYSDSFGNSDNVTVHVPMYSTSMTTFIDKENYVNFSSDINPYSDTYVIDSDKSSVELFSNAAYENVAFTIKYEVKEEFVQNVSDMNIMIKLPVSSNIEYIELDGVALDAGQYKISNGNVITIPVTNYSGECTVYVDPDSKGMINSYAIFNCTDSNGDKKTNIIGAIGENYSGFSMESKDEVIFESADYSVNLNVIGKGYPGNAVKIYVDDVLAAEDTISKAGRYSTEVSLIAPENNKKYTIKAVSTKAAGTEATYTKKVTALEEGPDLKTATLHVETAENEYETYDLMDTETFKYIAFQPGNEYKVTVEYDNRETIEKVYVVSERGGNIKKMEAKWNESKKAYVTEGFFNNDADYIPGDIYIEYVKVTSEDSTSSTDETSVECTKAIVSMPRAAVAWVVEPNGYVYEGVANNRLEDVEMTIYYKETLDMKEAVLWGASDYNQMNPVMTDSIGSYAWDLPEGYWQVKAEKEGYDTVYSEWTAVPPVQTNMNLKMTKTEAPQVTELKVYESFAIVKFDQYIDPTTIGNMTLTDSEGNEIEVNVMYDDSEVDFEGNVYATEYTLEFVNTVLEEDSIVTLNLNENILNSSGKPVKANAIEIAAESRVVAEDTMSVTKGESYTFRFDFVCVEPNGITVATEDSSLISLSDVETDGKGGYYVTVRGLSVGDACFTISVDGTTASKKVAVTVLKKDIPIREGIDVNGYQISTVIEGFRTIYSVESEIDGKDVVNVGIVYSLGDYVSEDDLYVGSDSYYVAYYKGTSVGICPVNYSGSETATSYAMTMKFSKKTVSEFTAKYRIRAFAELEDGTYVYSNAYEYNYFDVAEILYQNQMMSNLNAHNYLYNEILTVVDPNYVEVKYDFNNILCK